VRQERFVDVRCDECGAAFEEHALGRQGIDEQGRWKTVAPRHAPLVVLQGGYGWYLDPRGSAPGALLCAGCADRLLSSFLSLRRAILAEEA
jgi:hypothetical protein